MISKTLFAIAAVVVGVQASPVPKPQGVTALIAPTAAVPSQCSLSYNGLFAIAAIKAEGVPIPTAAVKLRRQVATQLSDAQPGIGSSTAAVVTQLPDAQPGVGTSTVNVITQISDAQPQAPTATVVTQISDGQIQAPSTHMWHTAMSQIGDGQVQAFYSVPVITQISDAQPQAPTATAISQISDAQPQAPSTTSVISQISDAQPQAGTSTSTGKAVSASASATASASASASTSASGTSTGSAAAPSVSMVACKTNSTLELDLNNGYLKDGKGRIGYIASNYQFQFDAGVPQTGAIYTTGFSVCENGTLALGGSAVFWQCLSGSFYNLYDRYWAPQCSPVFLRVVGLKDC